MSFALKFKKALLPGTRWIRTNHVNPRAAQPVEVTVIKNTPHEAILSFEDQTSYLTWPHKIGATVTQDDSGWHILDTQGRVILTYAPAATATDKVVEALLETTPDFEHGGGKVTSPQENLRDMTIDQVTPNIVIFHHSEGNIFKPAGWTLLYFMDSEQAAAGMKAGKIDYPMFHPGSAAMRFGGYSMINAIWKKGGTSPHETPERRQAREAKRHVVGALEAYKNAESIFVDNISVRPGWRKNTIGLKLIQALERKFPGLPITHSPTTKEGYNFFKKTGYLKHHKADTGGEWWNKPKEPTIESCTAQIVEALLENNDDDDDPKVYGVDLDGTLAKHLPGKYNPAKIGNPIPKMVARVRRWVSHGKKVKLFTARADDEKAVIAIKKWLKDNELPDLEITNVKSPDMTEFWDDKAVAVEKNTGKIKEAKQQDLSESIIGKDIKPAYARMGDTDDAEVDNAARQPFTAMELASRRKRHHPKLWNAVKGSPYERGYRRKFNPVESVQIKDRGYLTESPEIETLKKHAVHLDPEERAQVMKAGAVWHHGLNGEATPAVRKAVVNNKTWYFCATHRAGQVRPTLKGAISAFEFVKTTA